jgi:hypothetical protein
VGDAIYLDGASGTGLLGAEDHAGLHAGRATLGGPAGGKGIGQEIAGSAVASPMTPRLFAVKSW